MFKKFLIFSVGVLTGVAFSNREVVCEKLKAASTAARNKFNECCGSKEECCCKTTEEKTVE